MKNFISPTIQDLLCGYDCSCGQTHKCSLQVKKNPDIALECRDIVKAGGILFLFADDTIRPEFVDRAHERLSSVGFSVTRFSAPIESGASYELPEGCNIILAIGNIDTICVAKVLALSHDTALIVIPNEFNLVEIFEPTSVIDYGGVKLTRPSRAPNKILLFSQLYADLQADEYTDKWAELFALSTCFCDYAYRSIKNGEFCDKVIKFAYSVYEDILTRPITKRISEIDILLDKVMLINCYLSMLDRENGAEQVSESISRFLSKRERTYMKKGERLIFSAYLTQALQLKFLQEDNRYLAPDINLNIDFSKKLYAAREGEIVKNINYDSAHDYGFEDYMMKVYRKDLLAVCLNCYDLIKKFYSLYKRMRKDGGYKLREYLSIDETLDIISTSPCQAKGDTLLSFIKDRGLLEFKNSIL